MLKRLSKETGAVIDSASPTEGDSKDKVVRRAILVHAGPGDETAVLMSGDGEIKFDEARIKRIVDNQNALMEQLETEYGGADKTPLGAYAPILDSHESDSNDRIVGRLGPGRLKFERRDVPKVGKNVPCAVSEGITWLGAETVAKVLDGRIYHLSIGINESSDTLGETSTVIEPAAPGAMLLKKGPSGATPKGDPAMASKLKKLQAASVERVKQLAAVQESLTTLIGGAKKTAEKAQLSARKSDVTHRLTGLMRSGKLTPAEFKKMDLTKLSALPKETLDTVISAYDVREPVIKPGQVGSANAADFADIGKSLEERQMKRLKAEARKDVARLTGKKLSAEEQEEHKKLASEEHVEPAHKLSAEEEKEHEKKLSAHMSHLEEMGKHLAAGDMDKAKECHKKLSEGVVGMKHLGLGESAIPGQEHGGEEAVAEKADLQAQVDEMSTQMARLAGMVEELMKAEVAEGHELDAAVKEEEKPAPAAQE